MSEKGKQEEVDLARGKKEGEGTFFMNVIRKGWRRVFGILFAFRFKFVYTKSESDFFRTSIFFKLTIYKGVVSYTKVLLLQKRHLS